MKQHPCHNCTDRYIGCHAGCERYKSVRAKQDEANAKAGAYKKAVREIEDWRTQNIVRQNKRKRGRK